MSKYEKLMSFDKFIIDLYGKMLFFRRFPLLIQSSKIRKNNHFLKQKRRSDDCYIIGLGPSLKEVDLKSIKGDLIVTNRFYKIENSTQFSLTAYVLSDNFFFAGDKVDDFKKAVEMFPNTDFILNGLYLKNILSIYPSNKNFYYFFMWDGFCNRKTRIDCTKLLPISENVVCTAIYLGLFMGYKRIYLLGCDFNSFASKNALHVYKDDDPKRLWSMRLELFQYSFSADLHMQLDQIAKRDGKKIINITKGSLIDAYEFDNDMIKTLYKQSGLTE